MGGDLNESLQFDERAQERGRKFHSNASKLLFDRLEDLGLIESYKIKNTHKSANRNYVRTLRSKGTSTPWQNDYLFVNYPLEKQVLKVEVVDNDEVRKYSDYNIVIITLEIN